MTRTERILKLIVEHFIKTAQPVGSQTLLDEYDLNCSSATVRAEMNALEKAGYLEKTHTSSGRVPSKAGYEYYVEHLRQERLDDSIKYALQSILDKKTQSVEEVIRQSCEILANMTNLASVVLGPKVNEEKLVSVQIIPLGNNTATAVFVTDQGYVENKTFMVEDKIDIDEVGKTVGLLNDRLKGTPIADLVPKMEAMKPALSDYIVGHDAIYQAILQTFLKFASERMNLYGKENLLDQPEFADDAKKLRRILSLIDNPKALREALEADGDEGKDLNVTIAPEGSDDVAIVSAKIAIPGGQNASISLVGPTRMDYERALALLGYVSSALDDYFGSDASEEEGEPTSCKKKPQA
ncbi:MAG: heat-inducible transcriptional repressor HrcA [Bacilli bacterium]|nr:heat-inducible transcriptional repressor HrcA [Bacilli bacterium]